MLRDSCPFCQRKDATLIRQTEKISQLNDLLKQKTAEARQLEHSGLLWYERPLSGDNWYE